MKVVEYMGEYWRLTNRQYLDQLRAVRDGGDFDVTVGRRLSLMVEANVTDLTSDQARDLISILACSALRK